MIYELFIVDNSNGKLPYFTLLREWNSHWTRLDRHERPEVSDSLFSSTLPFFQPSSLSFVIFHLTSGVESVVSFY